MICVKFNKSNLTKLFRELKSDIGDDYRASEEDTLPSMQVTVGAKVVKGDRGNHVEWDYQTGDNSYSGSAYFYPIWAVVSLYRRSDSKALAKEVIDQIYDQIEGGA